MWGPAAGQAQSLPSGGNVSSGSATITTSGSNLLVTQTSRNAIVSWQNFSVGGDATAHFENGTGATLNRVTGNLPSSIDGSLTATGSLYLINPAGVAVGSGGMVKTGGSFVASTHDAADADFLDGGDLTLKGASKASVVNKGFVTSLSGDVVLTARRVENAGTIEAPNGSVGLLGGYEVLLRDTSLADGKFAIKVGGADTEVINTGTVRAAEVEMRANGGSVQALAGNTKAIVKATGVKKVGGRIFLTAGNGGTVKATQRLVARRAATQAQKHVVASLPDVGPLPAARPDFSGGEVHIAGGTVGLGGEIDAAGAGGKGGTIMAIAADTLVMDGGARLDASGASGGFVETSGAAVSIGAGASVTTLGSGGPTGTWLIDPTNFTVSAGSGPPSASGIGAETLMTSLATTNFTIQTAAAGAEAGDITVAAPLTWSSSHTLKLDAAHSIAIDAPITITGAGGLALVTNGGGTLSFAGGVQYTGSGGSLFINSQPYTLLYSMADLQGVNGDLSGKYALAKSLDASAIPANGVGEWIPLGTDGAGGVLVGYAGFMGVFTGLGNTISNLNISVDASYAGLFGYSGGTISDIGLAGGSVFGHHYVGGLVGRQSGGNISRTWTTANVSGLLYVGGLVGESADVTDSWAGGDVRGSGSAGGLVGLSSGTISRAYATGAVRGDKAGGLVGESYSIIRQAYATGAVTGADGVGGLIGYQAGGIIFDSYATGAVTGVSEFGGLVGHQESGGDIVNSFFDSYSTGQGGAVGIQNGNVSTVGAVTSDPLQSAAANYAYKKNAYTASGWTFTSGAGDWYMIEGQTRPFGAWEYSTNIVNSHQLQLVNMDLAASYTLGRDLDLAGEFGRAGVANPLPEQSAGMWNGGFVPLGRGGSFSGNFSGLGHTISNLIVIETADYTGLFAYSSGNISDIGLIGGSVAGRDYTGGLVGRQDGGNLTQVYATGAVSGTGHVGGLVGTQSGGSITDSYATGKVDGGSGDHVGGLVGYQTGSIMQAYATGEVSGANFVGGLVGTQTGGSLTQAYATGKVDGSGTMVGGLVGLLSSGGVISQSYATGKVDGGTGNYVGGLVGFQNSSSVTKAYATGTVNGGDSIGGLVGTQVDGVISESYATGAVNGGGTYVGGLVGQQGGGGSITDSYAIGNVTGSGDDVGGLVGYADGGTITRTYATGTVDGRASVGGLVGNADGETVVLSYATGAVSASGNYAGGLVGYQKDTTVADSYASGPVAGVYYVGGLAGELDGGSISTSYATGAVSGQMYLGGLFGWVNGAGTVTDSYFDTETTGQTGAGGLTTAQLQAAVLPAGFDSAAWGILPGISYPYLKWRFPAGPSVVSGKAVDIAGGNDRLGVGLGIDGNIAAYGHTGANGYYNFMVDPVTAGSPALAWLTGERFTGATTTSRANAVGEMPASGIPGFGQGMASGLDLYAETVNVKTALPTYTDIATIMARALYGDGTGVPLTSQLPDVYVLRYDGSCGCDVSFFPGDLNSPQASVRIDASAPLLTWDGVFDSLFPPLNATILAAGDVLVTTGNSIAAGDINGPGGGSLAMTVGGNLTLEQDSAVVSGTGPLTLTVNGDLSLGADAALAAFGGDLTATVGGNVTLGGAPNNALQVLGFNSVRLSAGGDFTMAPEARVAAAGTGDAIQIAVGGKFDNQAGADALFVDPNTNARWRVYLATPAGGHEYGGLDSQNTAIWNTAAFTPVTAAGNRYVFAYQPTLTFKTFDKSKTYGDAFAAYSYSVSGLMPRVDGAYQADLMPENFYSGTPQVSSAGALPTADVGAYAITISGNAMTPTGAYALAFVSGGMLTVVPRALTVTAAGLDKVYDGTTAASVTFGDNRVTGDILTITGSASFGDKNVGSNKTVTVSGIAIGGADAGNYTFNTTAATLASITPRALAVTATGLDKVYDGTTAATVVYGYSYLAGDALTVSGTALFGDKNVGTAKTVSVSGIMLGGADAGNYTANTTATTSADITPRALAVTATGLDKVYDGTSAATVAFGDNRVAGDALTISGAALFGDKNVGTAKTVSVSGIALGGIDAGNYTFNTATTTFASITPRALAVTAAGIDKIYDGTTTAAVTFGDNRLAGDALTITGSALFGDKNVGTAKTVTVSGIALGGTDAGNYTFNTTATTLASITPRALAVTAAGIDKIYDGTTAATVTFGDNRLAGDGLTITGSALFGDKNVGSNKTVSVSGITLGGTDAGNYTANATATTLASITPRALAVTATGLDKVYDGTTTATVTFDDNRLAGDGLTITGSALFGDKNVGSNKTVSVSGITLGGADAGNYSFNAATTTTADITPAALTITANDANKVYDGLAWSGGNGVSYSGFVPGEDDAVLGGALAYGGTSQGAKNAGNYAITASGLSSGNYAISYAPGTLTIGARPITVTALGGTSVYGDSPTDPGLSATNLAPGEAVSVLTGLSNSFGIGPATGAGDHGLSVAGTLANANYTVTGTVGGIWTVNPALLTVTAKDAGKVYGDPDPALTYAASGWKNGDGAATVLTGGLTRAAGENVGSYAISQGSLAANANYTIAYTGADFAVTPAALTITAADGSMVYGDPLPVLGYTVSGWKNGQTDALLDGVTVTTDATSASDVGTGYATAASGGTLSSAAAGNYIIGHVDGHFAVTPRAITVSADDQSRIYGEANPALSFTVGGMGLANGDTLSGSLATAAGVASNVGSYAIDQGTLAASSNYTMTFNDGTLTVTPRTITVSADDQSRVYGEANPALSFTVGGMGLANGDTLSGSLATAAGVASNVGSYAIDQGTLAASSNYTMTFNDGTLTVTPRSIAVSADDQSRVYGEANPALSFTVGGMGLANGDALSGSLATAAGLTSNVGSYAIDQGTLAASSNYTMTFNDGTLTVTPRTITVSADDQSRLLGDPDPALTWRITGGSLASFDTLGGVFIGSLARDPGELPGTYTIGRGTLAADANYTLGFVAGSFTIEPAQYTGSQALERQRDDHTPVLTAAGGGLCSSGILGPECVAYVDPANRNLGPDIDVAH